MNAEKVPDNVSSLLEIPEGPPVAVGLSYAEVFNNNGFLSLNTDGKGFTLFMSRKVAQILAMRLENDRLNWESLKKGAK